MHIVSSSLVHIGTQFIIHAWMTSFVRGNPFRNGPRGLSVVQNCKWADIDGTDAVDSIQIQTGVPGSLDCYGSFWCCTCQLGSGKMEYKIIELTSLPVRCLITSKNEIM